MKERKIICIHSYIFSITNESLAMTQITFNWMKSSHISKSIIIAFKSDGKSVFMFVWKCLNLWTFSNHSNSRNIILWEFDSIFSIGISGFCHILSSFMNILNIVMKSSHKWFESIISWSNFRTNVALVRHFASIWMVKWCPLNHESLFSGLYSLHFFELVYQLTDSSEWK